LHNEFRGDEGKKERKQFLLVGWLLEQRGFTLKRERERERERGNPRKWTKTKVKNVMNRVKQKLWITYRFFNLIYLYFNANHS